MSLPPGRPRSRSTPSEKRKPPPDIAPSGGLGATDQPASRYRVRARKSLHRQSVDYCLCGCSPWANAAVSTQMPALRTQ